MFVLIDLDPFLFRNICQGNIFIWKFHGTKSVLIEDYCYFINLLILKACVFLCACNCTRENCYCLSVGFFDLCVLEKNKWIDKCLDMIGLVCYMFGSSNRSQEMFSLIHRLLNSAEIGRASCRERV